MYKKTISLFTILFLMSITFAVVKTYADGYALSGIGARALSMGGAFRGLADDFSAAYWNPAGLTQLESSQISGLIELIYPEASYKPQFDDYTADPSDTLHYRKYGGYQTREEVENEKITYIFPNIGGFYKVELVEGLTTGLSVFVPYGLGGVWDLYEPPPGYFPLKEYPEDNWKSNIGVIDIHPSIAKEITPTLSIGAGLSIMYGMIEFRQVSLQGPTGAPYPVNYMPVDMQLEGTGWGMGGNLGMLYKPMDNLSIGAAIRFPATIKFEGTADLELYHPTAFINRDYNPDNEVSDDVFPNDNNLTSSLDGSAELPFPMNIGIGVAVYPTPKLTITADVDHMRWSVLDSIEIDFTGTSPIGTDMEDRVMICKWEDTIRFSVGTEYLIGDNLALRGGFWYCPSPVPDETFSPLIPDLGDKNSFNIGFGYFAGAFTLDFVYEYVVFSDRNIHHLDANEDGEFDNLPGEYSGRTQAALISLSYHFF